MIGSDVPTFKQYVKQIHRKASLRHGITLLEARRELPASNYWADWRAEVVTLFNEGAGIPTKLWRSFDETLQRRILRTPRALRDDELTRELRSKTPNPEED